MACIGARSPPTLDQDFEDIHHRCARSGHQRGASMSLTRHASMMSLLCAPLSATSSTKAVKKKDFEVLSEFRYQLRLFLRFSEELLRQKRITPLQYLLLLHIKGYPGRYWATVGEPAQRLQ